MQPAKMFQSMFDRIPILVQSTYLASSRVFWCAVRVPNTPMSLISDAAIFPNTLWLPWLVEGLEGEDVHAPVEYTADGRFPVGPGRVYAGDSGLVV
jgi:hypothetical protein